MTTQGNGGHVIETKDLTKRYGDVVAVDHLSLRVPRGGVFGFLGPNGSGKTTTMGMLLGLVHPTSGEARASSAIRRATQPRCATTTGGGGFGGGATLPDTTHATVLLSIYTLVFLAGAFWLFERRDVQGATGG